VEPEDNSSGGSVVGGGLELPSSRYSGASDGAGHRLGSDGGGGGAVQGMSAREAARQRWASLGTTARQPRESLDTRVTQSKASVDTSARQSRDSVDTRVKPKATVDTSAGRPTDLTKSPEIQNLPSKHAISLVNCPVCSKQMSEQEMNNHLDECLASQEDKDDHDQVVDDPFDDDDNDALLMATVEVEKSINLDSDDEPLVQSNIVLSDSDDEPLIKRPKKRKREDDSKHDELFGDMTAQDDQDILAALEDSTNQNANESMFACPICDKLLSHNIMFKHLDTCLASM